MATAINKTEKVKGKIFISGELENISPLALSDGQTIYSDADLYRDHQGKPMIPATSFMGALKSYIEENASDKVSTCIYYYLFGYRDKKGDRDVQSHFIANDLICTSDEIITNIRDGVKIDPETNLAVNKGKYEYEILEPGHSFSFKAEICMRHGVDEDEVDEMIRLIRAILRKESIFQVGALTSFGFGQLKVKDMKRTPLLQGEAYFNYLEKNEVEWSEIEGDTKFELGIATFRMELQPTTPLFIGGGQINTPNADDASLQSKGSYILSAKSLKGAVRHHAYRIANTVHNEDIAAHLCNLIFGNRDKKKLTKSKFWTADAKVNNPGTKKSQSRVAIDRFTGGSIEAALFSTEPAWPTKNTTVTLTWILKAVSDNDAENDATIGLLLLVARDLMTEMLAIGGDKAIGRGRFKKISYNFILKEKECKDDDNIEMLDEFIEIFLNYKNNKGNE